MAPCIHVPRRPGATGNLVPEERSTEADRLIRLSVPGSLEYRDVALRVVGTACRLLRPSPADASRSFDTPAGGRDDDFATAVVSAFSEAFNNVALHGYKDAAPEGPCRIDIEISADATELSVAMRDWGKVHDPRDHATVPEALPERGMGLFIIRSFMDEIRYEPGPPNVLTLKKKWPTFL